MVLSVQVKRDDHERKLAEALLDLTDVVDAERLDVLNRHQWRPFRAQVGPHPSKRTEARPVAVVLS